jgi:hypothetical protein
VPLATHLGFLPVLSRLSKVNAPRLARGFATDLDAELVADLCARDIATHGYNFEPFSQIFLVSVFMVSLEPLASLFCSNHDHAPILPFCAQKCALRIPNVNVRSISLLNTI